MSSQIVSKRILNIISVPAAALILLALLMALMLSMPVGAEGGFGPNSGSSPLIVGTSLNPTGTSHDMYAVDVVGNSSNPLGLNHSVGGATYDAANNRVLFTSSDGSANIDQLYEWVPGAGSATNLGTITDGAIGGPQRIDGLAFSGGVLYGSYAGGEADDGLFTIDMNTLVATSIYPFPNSVSGIDADPNTGIIYGVDDTTGSLISINPAGSMTTITAYPAGQTDIDGLAVGDNGRAYLVTDEPGSFYVYNLNANAYETPLTNPWTSADTFSGAAFISSGPPPAPSIVMTKTVGFDPNTCATTTSLSVPVGGGGTVVGYCYTVMNTGNITLPMHDLVDSELGAIFTGLNYDLGPGASVDTVAAGAIVSAVITQTTTNVATWTAYLDTATFVTSTASATVTVMPPTSVSLTGITGSTGTSPLAFIALFIVLAGMGAVIFRKRFA